MNSFRSNDGDICVELSYLLQLDEKTHPYLFLGNADGSKLHRLHTEYPERSWREWNFHSRRVS